MRQEPTLVQVMAWCHWANKPLPDPVPIQIYGTKGHNELNPSDTPIYIMYTEHYISGNKAFELQS